MYAILLANMVGSKQEEIGGGRLVARGVTQVGITLGLRHQARLIEARGFVGRGERRGPGSCIRETFEVRCARSLAWLFLMILRVDQIRPQVAVL